MRNYVCSRCGSSSVRRVNIGFDGWFAFWWALAAAAMLLGLFVLVVPLSCVAGLKTVFALFQWGCACKRCGCREAIPADSPVGKAMAAGQNHP